MPNAEDTTPGPLASDDVGDEEQRIEHSDDDKTGFDSLAYRPIGLLIYISEYCTV